MEREVRIDEIGKRYGLNDMVKADCNGCEGCSACCTGMGTSVVLDPLDVHRLVTNLHVTFEELLKDKAELQVVDGIILPNLKMAGREERCAFLDAAGRCQIHGFRPGLCRLFPLGRYYENRSFQYYLQIHECPKENRSKVKVRKWIDTPQIKDYEQFVLDWHYFIKDLQEVLKNSRDEEGVRDVSMYVLKLFYLTPFAEDKDFYGQFKERMIHASKLAAAVREAVNG